MATQNGTLNIPGQNVSATGGVQSSALMTLTGLAQPQISNAYWWQYGFYTMFNTFNTMGMMREVAGDYAQHFEGGHPVPAWTVGSVVTPSGGPGQPIVLGVATTSVSTITNTVYPQATETVRFKNTYSGYISNVALVGGVWQVTVQPFDPSWVLTASIGDGIWQQSQLSIQGSQDPLNTKVTPDVEVSYPLQIVRNTGQIDGSGELTALWTTTDQFGNTITPYYKEWIPQEIRQTVYLDNSIFFSYPNLNGVASGANSMVGMDYAISNGGYTQSYPIGNFGLLQIQELARVAMKNSSGNEFFGFGGPDFDFAAQNGLSAIFSQNPIVYDAGGINEPMLTKFAANEGEFSSEITEGAKGIVVNFRRVKWGPVNFIFTPYQRIGSVQAGGMPGFKESSWCFWIPMSKAANAKGTMIDRFKIAVRAYNGKSRKMQIWTYGGQSPENKNGYDGTIIDTLSEMGPEYNDLSKFLISKGY